MARLKLYRVNISPEESEGEGEDHDEWFPSLNDARARRRQLIEQNPSLQNCRYQSDYGIDEVKLLDLPRKQLALAVLNRRGIAISRIVVQPYQPSDAIKLAASRQELENQA